MAKLKAKYGQFKALLDEETNPKGQSAMKIILHEIRQFVDQVQVIDNHGVRLPAILSLSQSLIIEDLTNACGMHEQDEFFKEIVMAHAAPFAADKESDNELDGLVAPDTLSWKAFANTPWMELHCETCEVCKPFDRSDVGTESKDVNESKESGGCDQAVASSTGGELKKKASAGGS